MNNEIARYCEKITLFVMLNVLVVFSLAAQNLDTSDVKRIMSRITELEKHVTSFQDINDKIESLNDSITDLRQETKRLDSLNINLTESVEYSNRIEYDEKYSSIVVALERSDKLLESYLNTIEKLKNADLIVDLLAINNPTSNTLGFKFTDVVVRKAERVFHQKLSNDTKVAGRWKGVVDKIVNNNFINTILKSNPITDLVSNVISSASSFVREKKRNGENSSVLELENAFEEKDIEEFLKELEDYIVFYEELSRIGNEYHLELASLLEKSSELDVTVKNFRKELLSILSIDPSVENSVTIAFGKRYDLAKDIDFSSPQDVILDPNFITAVEHVSSFEILELQVQGIESEYKKIFRKFLDSYITQIQQAKALSLDDDDISVKRARVERLLKKINSFKGEFLD